MCLVNSDLAVCGEIACPIQPIVTVIMLALSGMPQQTSADARVNLRIARRLAPRVVQSDMPVTRSSMPIATMYMEISAYSPRVCETDGNPTITASGKKVYVGGVAADLSVLPFGSIVVIPNYNNGNPCEVVDTGSAIKGNKLDVFLWSTDAAIRWGRRRNVRVEVLYVPKVQR